MRAKEKFKKGTFSRRVFSILMALAMVISLMPMNAMEVKAEGSTMIQITSMTLNVDWSKIPTFTVAESAPDFEELPVTMSGNGVGGILGLAWAVKEPSGDWMPKRSFTINESDTYALCIGVSALPGYRFAEEIDADLKDIVTSNVNVAQILPDGWNGSSATAATAFLELGTVSQIAAAKEEATSTKKITSMTLDVDWSKIPTLEEGQSAKSAESALSNQEPPVTVSGNGVEYFTCGWAVKALQSHVESEYIRQNNYDESKKYDYWVPLELYRCMGNTT